MSKGVLFLVFCILSEILLSQTVTESRSQVGFIPTDEPGCLLWIRADSLVYVSNGAVDSIQNLASEPISFNQVTQSRRPTVNSNWVNNRAALRFDGVNDFLINSSWTHPPGNLSVTCVYGNESESFSRLLYIANGPFELLTNQTSGTYTATSGTFGPSSAIDGPQFLTLNLKDDDTSELWRGLEETEVGLPWTATAIGGSISLGGKIGQTPYNGSIAEIIVYDHALTLEVQLMLNDYLQCRYAPSVDLGADINAIGFCDTTITVGPGEYESVLWSDGSTGDSLVATTPGLYSIEVIDVFGSTSYDTLELVRPGVFLDSFTLCSGSDSIWDTGLDDGLFELMWNVPNSGPSLLIQEGGVYALTITDSEECSFTTPDVLVSEDFFPVSASLGPDLDLCSGNTIGFVSGADEVVSALWNETTPGLELVVESSGTYTVEAINENNCVARDTIEVDIIGEAPLASFTFENTCFGQSTQFLDTSIPLGSSVISEVMWDFGGGATGEGSLAEYTFAQADTFSVQISVTTDVGCEAIVDQDVIITPYPVAAMDFDVLCNGKLVTFYDASTVSQGNVVDQDWLFDNFGFASGNEATYVFDEVGAYPVRLIVTSEGGCRDTLIQTVFVNGSPISDFSADPVCLGEPMLFTATPDETLSGPIQSYLWDFEGVSNIFETTTFTWFTAGPHFVELTVTSALGCSDDTLMTVFVSNDPVGGFNDNAGCFGQPVLFTDTSLTSFGDEVVQWDWFFGSEGTSQQSQPSFQFNTPGTYNVALNVVTDAGCEDQVDRLITIDPLPDAEFNIDPLIGQPPFTPEITNLSNGAVDYLWTFDFGQTSSDFEPMHAFTDSGIVAIDLVVTNEFGCSDQFSQNILLTALQTDLVLSEVDYVQTGEYISPIITVRNLSNYRVDNFTIQAEVAEGTTLQEFYNMPLAPDEIRQISMNSSLFYSPGFALPYLCIQLVPPENRSDLNPQDNRECISLGMPTEAVYWIDPSPNPVGSTLTLRIANAGEGILSAQLYNALGMEAMSKSFFAGSSYVETFELDVSDLTPGRYVLRLSLGLEERTYRIQVLRD